MSNATKQYNKKQILSLAVLAIVVLPALVLELRFAAVNFQRNNMKAAVGDLRYNNTSQIQQQQEQRVFPEPQVKAKAYAVYDDTEGRVIAGKNENALLPLASVTKIFTSIIALQHLNPDTIITIKQEDLATEGNSGLKAGEKWRLKTLISYMLTVSSNDAASALERTLKDKTHKNYKDLFAQTAAKIGLQESFAVNPSGLDESVNFSGAYGSATEVSKALAYAAKNYPDIFAPTTKRELEFTSLSGYKHIARNTNQSIPEIFNAIASKTGFTDLAGGNLAVAFEIEPGHVITIVALGSDKTGRFEDIKKLYKSVIQYYSN